MNEPSASITVEPLIESVFKENSIDSSVLFVTGNTDSSEAFWLTSKTKFPSVIKSNTVTERLFDEVPPDPVQLILNEYWPAVSKDCVEVPDVSMESVQSPDAVHEVVYDEDQVREKASSTKTLDFDEEKFISGELTTGGLGSDVDEPPPPPPPQLANNNKKDKFKKLFFI